MQIQISTLSSYKNEIEDELLKFVDGRDFQTILSSI